MITLRKARNMIPLKKPEMQGVEISSKVKAQRAIVINPFQLLCNAAGWIFSAESYMEIWRKTTMHGLYRNARCHRQAGFTMVELIIAIAVIAILAAIAVPNIINWLPNYRLKAAARDMVSNMQKAKMEAVKANKDVVIQFTPVAYAASGQVGSYQIFVDDDSDGTFDAGERVLAQVNMPKNVSLYTTTFTGDITGFNSRALPRCKGSVKIRNNNSRYYMASLSFAGNVKLRISSDGTTWN